MNREIARECLTNGGRRTSEEEIERFLKAFSEGAPVLPMPFFCDALTQWANLFRKEPPPQGPHPAFPDIPVDPEDHLREVKERREFADMADRVFLRIRKSNLLWRMLYGGEKPRSTPCPKHYGRWSGCKMPEEMECKGACADGINITGWLKEE